MNLLLLTQKTAIAFVTIVQVIVRVLSDNMHIVLIFCEELFATVFTRVQRNLSVNLTHMFGSRTRRFEEFVTEAAFERSVTDMQHLMQFVVIVVNKRSAAQVTHHLRFLKENVKVI